MTIRSRLALWYSAMLGVSLLLMLGVLYYELAVERARGYAPEDVPEQMGDVLLFYGLPTAVLLLLGGGWLTRRILAPVTELTRAVEAVHAENLGERLPRTGNGDELDRLTARFNAMLDRLADSFARIREFTLHASHELKTPLTILSGEMETMLRDPRTTPEQQDALAGQLEEIQRLARIVDDLSLLTKADAGLVCLAQDQIPFDELVREVIVDAEVLAAPRSITVECPACEPVTVRGDRDRLRQLLLNLVDNAAKYNVTGGTLRIALRGDATAAELRITNTGPAIPSAALPRVFDRFYRGENAHALRVKGTGLGLCLVKWIAVSHGGEIKLASTPDGKTEATVRLPLA